jgi:hypothetical protein
MASSINLGELYNYYVNKYQDKKTAAQYTAFQLLSNPSGSVAGLKEPQKWYSQDEWLNYEAPAYLAIKNYSGADPTNLYVSAAVNKSKNLAELQTELRRIADTGANSKTTWKNDPAYKKVPKDFILGKVGDVTTNDLINQVTTLWSQKESADKKYKSQLGTHPFAQYGLPDPTLRFTVYNTSYNPSKPAEAPGSSFAGGERASRYDPNKFVPYKPAVDYINKATQSFGLSLLKKGISSADAITYSGQYKAALETAIQKKLDESDLSPFVQKVMELRKIRKP